MAAAYHYIRYQYLPDDFEGGIGNAFVLKRMATGSIDNSFGTNGTGHVFYSGGSGGLIAKTLRQPDGKILMAGYVYTGNRYQFFAARLLANGTMDNSFSASGQLILDYNGEETLCNAIALQLDGKILLGGGTSADMVFFNYLLCRLNSDGSLDNSFGNAGFTNFNGDPRYMSFGGEGIKSIAIQTDGNIVVGGMG